MALLVFGLTFWASGAWGNFWRDHMKHVARMEYDRNMMISLIEEWPEH